MSQAVVRRDWGFRNPRGLTVVCCRRFISSSTHLLLTDPDREMSKDE